MKLYTVFLSFVLFMSAMFCQAAGHSEYKYKSHRRYGNQRITVRQSIPAVRQLSGKLPRLDAVREGEKKFSN